MKVFRNSKEQIMIHINFQAQETNVLLKNKKRALQLFTTSFSARKYCNLSGFWTYFEIVFLATFTKVIMPLMKLSSATNLDCARCHSGNRKDSKCSAGALKHSVNVTILMNMHTPAALDFPDCHYPLGNIIIELLSALDTFWEES